MKIYYVKDCSSCYHHIYVKGDGFCSEEGRYADGKDMPEWCPLEDATGWVSVEERLPEIGVDILAFCFEDYIQEAYHERVASYEDGDAALFKSNVTDRYLSVTHWQPLPAPPEEG